MPATAISASLRRRATIALSNRSASWPPSPERKKNGAMNTAAASAISSPEWPPPSRNRMRMTSAFLRKLSLKAEKNWHQNSGAKRRVVMRWVDMAQIRSGKGTSCPTATAAGQRQGWSASLVAALDSHEQALGLGVLDPVDQLSAFMLVAEGFCHRDARLDQHGHAHGKIAFDPDVERQKDDRE